jgi:hypothetical protein
MPREYGEAGLRQYPKPRAVGWYHKLVLGRVYQVHTSFYQWSKTRHCKFIKVTRKGFNLLDVNTSKTIMMKACYAKGFKGKEIPPEQRKFTVWIPEWIKIGPEVAMDNAG